MSRTTLRRVQGFTLLELLIALVLLGLMLTLLFGGLRLAARSWDTVQRALDTADNVRAVEGFLRQELADIRPYRFRTAGQPDRLAFIGRPNSLAFVAPLPARIGLPGPRLIVIRFEQRAAEWRLTWQEAAYAAGQSDFSAAESAPVMELLRSELTNVEAFSIRYYGRQGDANTETWSDHWDDPLRLPRLIKVLVRLKGDAPWPDFIVAPLRARPG